MEPPLSHYSTAASYPPSRFVSRFVRFETGEYVAVVSVELTSGRRRTQTEDTRDRWLWSVSNWSFWRTKPLYLSDTPVTSSLVLSRASRGTETGFEVARGAAGRRRSGRGAGAGAGRGQVIAMVFLHLHQVRGSGRLHLDVPFSSWVVMYSCLGSGPRPCPLSRSN